MTLTFSKSAEVVVFGADTGQSKLTHYNALEDTDFNDFQIRSELKVSADDETINLLTKYVGGGRIKTLLSEII